MDWVDGLSAFDYQRDVLIAPPRVMGTGMLAQ